MNDKLNNALNEIDERLIEEAAYAYRAERNGLKAARNIGFSVFGVAAAAAVLTFGISHHLSSLPEKVNLLPTESGEASNNIANAIAENSLKTISVERIDISDVDPARISDCSPYFINAGNEWKIFDNDGNVLNSGNTIVVMDFNGYWVEYDITDSDGVIDELLDIRTALGKAEDVLGATLLPGNAGLSMGLYRLSENDISHTITAFFDDGSCLNYRLKCDTNHEQWTMSLLSDSPDYLEDKDFGADFFREERAGVYDSVRFSDGYGAYICDNNGEIRVVEHTEDGYFGHLPFGGKEYIYTLENTETGRREKYCVKENGDALFTSEDFLAVGGSEHQDDPQNIAMPSWMNIIDDMGSGEQNAIGASKVYNLSYAPDYNGIALQFLEDSDGKLFLYDFEWLYPCKIKKDEVSIDSYTMTINLFPEGREMTGDVILGDGVKMLFDGETWTLAEDTELNINERGTPKRITLYKGTKFTADIRHLPENPTEEDETGEDSNEAVGFTDNETGFLPISNQIFNMQYPEGYEGQNLQFFTDNNGCLFLTDFTWTYPCQVEDLSRLQENFYKIYIDFWPEGRELPERDINASTGAFISDDTLIFDMNTTLYIVQNGSDTEIVIPKGTVFEAYDNAPAGLDPDELREYWTNLISSVPDPNFLYPVGGDYAITAHMYGHTPESGYYNHRGIDIGIILGESVLAAADGEVILAEWYHGLGKCVMIEHADGVVTVYGHCDELYVSKGDAVTRGQKIAGAGCTGFASDVTLHFEVRINDEPVDPAMFQYQIYVNGKLSERTTFE